MGSEEIEPAVVIVVQPRRAHRPQFFSGTVNAAYTGVFRDIAERAVSIVPIQNVPVDASDVQLGPAVIVKIGRRYPHAVSFTRQASPRGHIREGAIVIISIEPVMEGFILLDQARNLRA